MNHLINIQALERYRSDLMEKVCGLYNQMAGGIIEIDALVLFYLESDGFLRDLVWYKLAGIFWPTLWDSAQGSDLLRYWFGIISAST